MGTEISDQFPFRSKFIEIEGSKIHYIDEGKGDPILFLHGNPTSCYLWRNIIPHLQAKGRCIAPDLIGMGKSDKPNISYSFFDHYHYVTKFIEKLDLRNITMVIHDWGSGLGFYYAHEHEDNIKGIAFMEAIFKTTEWSELTWDIKIAFKMMRTPFVGGLMIRVGNMFIRKMLPDLVERELTNRELKYYAEPFLTIKSRKPIRRWPLEVPLGGKPEKVCNVINAYNQWLQNTPIPKLCFYADPGLIIKKEHVSWIRENFPNIKMIDIGKGIHYIQEDNPWLIGSELEKWYQSI